METNLAMEKLKRAVKNGNLEELSPEKFQELGLQVDQSLGAEEYSCLHWACHYGKAEVGS